MYDDIETRLSTLGEPTAFDIQDFEYLLSVNVRLSQISFDGGIEYVKQIPYIIGSVEFENYINSYTFKKDKWLPLESDPYMKLIRVLTLRQLHNQAYKKETVKQLLTTTATSVNLDNLGASENVFRDLGEFPYTDFEFKLLSLKDEDVVIPSGLVLSDDENIAFSRVVDDVVIPSGAESVIVKVELEQYVEESDVKTENIITELPFGVEATQLDIFKNGSFAEDDDRYRIRIIASNDRYSTAGSEEAYMYHALSADSRIDDIVVLDENILDVNIYLASFSNDVDDLMIDRVYDACNKRYVRPLGDNLIVKGAEIVELDISATIEVFDLLKQGEIDTQIRANFENSFFIGQNFVRSDFIRKCHIDGVYRVDTEFEDVIVEDNQIIKLKTLSLNFVEAEL